MRMSKAPLGTAVAVVLGGGIEKDGITASARTAARAEAAAELALAQPEITVILTGNGRSEENRRKRLPSEASLMAGIIGKRGISRRRLLVEDESVDTMGNAILSAAKFLLGQEPRKIYVVTSPFHGDRALVVFRGVLGPAWTVELHASAVTEGDDVKGMNEAGGIEWARRFFETTNPGEISSAIDRLFSVGKQVYGSMRWLHAARSA